MNIDVWTNKQVKVQKACFGIDRNAKTMNQTKIELVLRCTAHRRTSSLVVSASSQFTRKPQACHNNMKALLKKAMKDQDHQAALAAAEAASAKKIQVTKSSNLGGKFFSF